MDSHKGTRKVLMEKRLGAQLIMGSGLGNIPKNTIHNGVELAFHLSCRIWKGATDNKGYGSIRAPKGFMGSKTGVVRVHRVAKFLELHFPVKCQVDHLCRNKLCLEVSHLLVIGPKTHGKISKRDQSADAK